MDSFITRALDESELEQLKSLTSKRGLVQEYRKLMTKILQKRLIEKDYPSPIRDINEGNWALRRAHRDGALLELETLLNLIGEK